MPSWQHTGVAAGSICRALLQLLAPCCAVSDRRPALECPVPTSLQAFFVALLLPLITSMRGMPLADLPGYLLRVSRAGRPRVTRCGGAGPATCCRAPPRMRCAPCPAHQGSMGGDPPCRACMLSPACGAGQCAPGPGAADCISKRLQPADRPLPPLTRVQGWTCFQGLTPSCGSDCSGAPLMPLLYVFANLRCAARAAASRRPAMLRSQCPRPCALPLPYASASPRWRRLGLATC